MRDNAMTSGFHPPTSMRAAVLSSFGGPEQLVVEERPLPACGEDEVLIRTDYAGLIYGDVEARRGTYYVKPTLPWTPGREVAGTIVAVGANVSAWKAGDRVAALILSGGGYAEYVVATAQRSLVLDGPPKGAMAEIIRLPERARGDQALIYLVNFRFAWLIFHAWARVPRGTTIFVHGAAGGMGSMIVQLGRAHDCTVIALCRSAAEISHCAAIGADHCIDTTMTDYVAGVRAASDGRGAQFAFNGVGGETFDRDPEALAPFGEILVYGYVAGKATFNPFKTDRCVALKTFTADNFFPTGQFAEATAAMQDWLANGPLISPGHTFPLAEVATAHQWLEEGRTIGKIVLTP